MYFQKPKNIHLYPLISLILISSSSIHIWFFLCLIHTFWFANGVVILIMVAIAPVVAWLSRETGLSITRILIPTMTRLIHSISYHTISLSSFTVVSTVVVHIKVLIVNRETRLSMSSFPITIMTLAHTTHSLNSFTVVITVEVHTLALIVKQGINFLVTIMTLRIKTNLHSVKLS